MRQGIMDVLFSRVLFIRPDLLPWEACLHDSDGRCRFEPFCYDDIVVNVVVRFQNNMLMLQLWSQIIDRSGSDKEIRL